MPLFFDLRAEDRKRDRVTISDGRGMSACILTYGATVQSLNVPDAHGDVQDVVLGYESPAAYDLQDAYLGAIVGRVAGRIRDAGYFENGRRIDLEPNQPYGVLHGGPVGFSYKTWEIVSRNACSVLLRLFSPAAAWQARAQQQIQPRLKVRPRLWLKKQTAQPELCRTRQRKPCQRLLLPNTRRKPSR
jgi:galactose mutarotase-like enzyme